ncbi:hypothetical protein MMPV_001471 [Pyropia vietnamensis]
MVTAAPPVTAAVAVDRLAALLNTAAALSARLSALTPAAAPAPHTEGAATPATDATSNRLLLLALSVAPSSRLLLTHPDYYSWPLEARRAHLGAPAVSALCKSILLINTRWKGTQGDPPDARNPQHLMVVVPYGRKLATQAVLRWSKARAPPGVSGKHFNWRLGDGEAVTGYSYNAVTPLGAATPVPVVVDASLWQVRVDEFVAWAGGVVADFSVEGAPDEE